MCVCFGGGDVRGEGLIDEMKIGGVCDDFRDVFGDDERMDKPTDGRWVLSSFEVYARWGCDDTRSRGKGSSGSRNLDITSLTKINQPSLCTRRRCHRGAKAAVAMEHGKLNCDSGTA